MPDQLPEKPEQGAKKKRSHPIAALYHRNFRLFWGGQLISLIGTWMQNVGQAWLVLQLTNSAFFLGLVSAVQFTPVLLFSLPAGVVADRLPKRTLLLFTQTVLMLQALVLGLLVKSNVVQYWHVLALAILLGMVNTLDVPARQAFVFELVGREDLMNAIALNSSAFNAARIVGPAVAGILMGTWGVGTAFLLNAASFLPVIAGLALIRLEGRRRGQESNRTPAMRLDVHGGHLWEGIQEGLSYIRKTPAISMALLLLGALSIFAMNFNILVPLFARNVLHQGATGYGFLMSAMGIGALTGALSLAFLSHRGPQRLLLFGGALGLSFFQMLLAPVRFYPLALVVMFTIGWSMITFVATVNTTVQANVPDELRGRVMSVYSLLLGGLTPFGSLFAGSVAHALGPPATLVIGGGIGLLFALSVIRRNSTGKIQEDKR